MNTVNTLPKFSEQYSKIIDAYFKDEIRPLSFNFCFCGTLAGGDIWFYDNRITQYTLQEFARMEEALLKSMPNVVYRGCGDTSGTNNSEALNHPDYEENLFKGMVKALEVLRTIHEERGEIIDQTPVFTKRELTNV